MENKIEQTDKLAYFLGLVPVLALIAVIILAMMGASPGFAGDTIKPKETNLSIKNVPFDQITITPNERILLRYNQNTTKTFSALSDISSFINVTKKPKAGDLDFVIKKCTVGDFCSEIVKDSFLAPGEFVSITPKPGTEKYSIDAKGNLVLSVWEDLFANGTLIPNATWWNFTWQYCQNITGTESSGETRTNELIRGLISNATALNYGRLITSPCSQGSGVSTPFNVINSSYILGQMNVTASSSSTYGFYFNNSSAVPLATNITGLFLYQDYDGGSSVIDNLQGNESRDGDFNGTFNSTGKFGKALTCDGSDDNLNVTTSVANSRFMNGNNWTIELYMRGPNSRNIGFNTMVAGGAEAKGGFDIENPFVTTTAHYTQINVSAANVGYTCTGCAKTGAWFFRAMRFDSSQANELTFISQNGTTINLATADAGVSNVDDSTRPTWLRGCGISAVSLTNVNMGGRYAGELDELIIWTIAVPNNQLNNYTTPLAVTSGTLELQPDIIAPTFSPCDPPDLTNFTSYNLTLNVTAQDDKNLSSVWLYGNFTGTWALNATNSSPVNGSAWSIFFPNLTNGAYLWGAGANDSTGNTNYSSNCSFLVNYTAPTTTTTVAPTTTTTTNGTTTTVSGNVTGSVTDKGVSLVAGAIFFLALVVLFGLLKAR